MEDFRGKGLPPPQWPKFPKEEIRYGKGIISNIPGKKLKDPARQAVGAMGGKMKAWKIAVGMLEQADVCKGGRPRKPTKCPRCGEPLPSFKQADAHCRRAYRTKPVKDHAAIVRQANRKRWKTPPKTVPPI